MARVAILSLHLELEVLPISRQREELELGLKEALILNKIWNVHI